MRCAGECRTRRNTRTLLADLSGVERSLLIGSGLNLRPRTHHALVLAVEAAARRQCSLRIGRGAISHLREGRKIAQEQKQGNASRPPANPSCLQLRHSPSFSSATIRHHGLDEQPNENKTQPPAL